MFHTVPRAVPGEAKDGTGGHPGGCMGRGSVKIGRGGGGRCGMGTGVIGGDGGGDDDGVPGGDGGGDGGGSEGVLFRSPDVEGLGDEFVWINLGVKP